MTHSPIVPPRGPFPTDIAIVGEAPGKDEVSYLKPFIGGSGAELNRMLQEAGIHPASVYFTNVFKIRPENNEIERFFGPRKSGAPGVPPLRTGKYLPRESVFWLELLRQELSLVQPKLILALGNTPLWALTGKSGIGKLRGAIHPTSLGVPLLATYHPAAILRTWNLRSFAVADLLKARQYLDGSLGEATFIEDLRLNPKVSDLDDLRDLVRSATSLSVDIETSRGQITMVGFGISPTCGFCIPFWDPDTCVNYWDTAEEEYEAWQFVRWALAQRIPKVLHNGLYDIQYLCKVTNNIPLLADDTILLHHALQPEMKKDLGTLGATYLHRRAWKELRKRSGDDIVKKDE